MGASFGDYGVDGEDLGWVEGPLSPRRWPATRTGSSRPACTRLLLDAAMNFAINAAMPGRDRTRATLEIKTEAMRPAMSGEHYRLRGEVVRLARQVAYAEATSPTARSRLVSRVDRHLPAPPRRRSSAARLGPWNAPALTGVVPGSRRRRPVASPTDPDGVRAAGDDRARRWRRASPQFGPTAAASAMCGRGTPGFADCYCCATISSQLAACRSCRSPRWPTTASATAMHRLLRGYKDGPSTELTACGAAAAWPSGRRLGWPSGDASGLDARAGWDVVTVVPSSHADGGSPGCALVQPFPDLAARYRPLLVRGPTPLDHLRAARRGFAVSGRASTGAGSAAGGCSSSTTA